jgi:ribonuclease-3
MRSNISAPRSRNSYRKVLFKKQPHTAQRTLQLERKKELQLFERHAEIRFKELVFLNQAFTHRSYANELAENGHNNERLEFLGDSVLGMVVSEYLYQRLPDQPEGELARIKSFVVSEASLSEISKRLRVDNFILIGKGEEYSGGRNKKAILADALEAIIGAYYLDSGFMPARKFVLKILTPEINKVLEDKHAKDYKTLLQEHVQKHMKTYPRYKVVQKTGPDHDRTFTIEVVIRDRSFGSGRGKNKKEAEQEAARIAYLALKEKGSQDSSPGQRGRPRDSHQ